MFTNITNHNEISKTSESTDKSKELAMKKSTESNEISATNLDKSDITRESSIKKSSTLSI